MNTNTPTHRTPKGHKLIRSWSGVGDNFANGRCECGVWAFNGWTERMGDVIRVHRAHLARVVSGQPEYRPHARQSRVWQVPVGPFSPVTSDYWVTLRARAALAKGAKP